MYYYSPTRQWYDIDMETKQISPVSFGEFDREEIYAENEGYFNPSEWMKYCCFEGPFNTLVDLLDGTIHGNKHDKEEQLKEFADINASIDGDCGEKVYEYLVSVQ